MLKTLNIYGKLANLIHKKTLNSSPPLLNHYNILCHFDSNLKHLQISLQRCK